MGKIMTDKVALVCLMAAVLCLAPAGSALAEITIGDHSFESQSMSAGIYNYIESPWASNGGSWASYEGQYGVTNVPDGTQYATPSNDDCYQDLATTYVSGVTYTLSALASARAGGAAGSADDWEIALYKGGTELAATTGTFSLVGGTWSPISVEYTATAVDDGQPLRVYFSSLGNGYKFVFDDVHLNTTTVANALISQSDEVTFASEAGITDSYTIALPTAPTSNVTITAAPGDGEIDIGNGAGVAKNLIFTPSDWQAKTVNVTAFDDTVYEGGSGGTPHITSITHSAQQPGGDSFYDGMFISDVQVSVVDNELTCGDWGYLPSDLNQDCYMNLFDFAEFALHYLDGV